MTKTKKDSEAYRLPSTSLLDDKLDEVFTSDEAFIREQILSVEKILESFNACAYISNVVIGSSVTQFEISLNPGVRIDKITKIQPEICMAMKEQRIRICAPIAVMFSST